MNTSPRTIALSKSVLNAPERPGTQTASQSLFALLLEVESRFRNKTRNKSWDQIVEGDISKAKGQKGSKVKQLTRYIE